MIKKFIALFALSAIISLPTFASAKEGCIGDCAGCHKLTEQNATELFKKLGLTVKSVKQSLFKGMFELLVEKDGRQGIVFVDFAKKHLFQGMAINLETMQPAASHEVQPPKPPTVDISKIPTDKAVVMGNPKGSKKLYVFSDPDCPYCRKGHTELKQLAKIAPDVAIHVMLFPLPMHPAAFDKSRTLLETKNLEQLDNAFDGKDVPKPTKDSSKAAIEEIIKFANDNNITGTPTMIMPDGRIEVGMRDAETMKKMLDGK
ncbi:MAG TPA: DsbC family protein [Desulfuromonadales bacterium]|nr:DsbC family protein [Desulfuromonadales bacterium]